MALAIDGTIASDSTWSSAASGTIVVSTTGSLGVLVVVVFLEQVTGSGLATVNSVTAPGLTFALRSSVSGLANGLGNTYPSYVDVEVWWAAYSSTLSSLTVTINASASIDDASLIAIPVSGCNTSSPWDTHAAQTNAYVLGAGGVATITQSTNNANDILLFIAAQAKSNEGWTAGNFGAAAATAAVSCVNDGAVNASTLGIQYLIVSATQASISDTITVDDATGGGTVCVIADAIVAAGAAVLPWFPMTRDDNQRPTFTQLMY